MKVPLSKALRKFVDEQAAARGYRSGGHYVRNLIQREQQRQQFRELLLEGANSVPRTFANNAYFTALRRQARGKLPGAH